jgi:Fe-S oxidoreductase
MEEKHFKIPIDLLQKCVRCGLCKSVCPTYRVNEEERSFARGRLALAQMVLSGELPLTKDVARQWDECAMCRRCEWICPNNVEYKEIMSKAKELQSNTLGKDPFKYTALSALELMQTNVGRTAVKLAGSLLSIIPKKN